jgi:hypothetical protein
MADFDLLGDVGYGDVSTKRRAFERKKRLTKRWKARAME